MKDISCHKKKKIKINIQILKLILFVCVLLKFILHAASICHAGEKSITSTL